MAVEATCGLCGAPSQANPCPECQGGDFDQDRTPKKKAAQQSAPASLHTGSIPVPASNTAGMTAGDEAT